MELSEVLIILRRRWISIAVVAATVFTLCALATAITAPRYTSTTQIVFAVSGGESVTDLAQGSNFAEKQMATYAQAATSPLVLEPVIKALDLTTTPAALSSHVTATVLTNTVILELSVTDLDRGQAARIANQIATELASVAVRLSPERADETASVRATTLAPAAVPTQPSSPDVLRNLILGGLLGLALGAGVAMFRHVLDTKLRSEADVRAMTDTSILGAIAFDDGVPSHPVILREDPRSAAAEAIRRLRTNMQFIEVAEGLRTLVISSSLPGEGKSTTAINLAVSLADAGSRVLLVDADLRRPSIAEYLGLEGGVGLTTVLIGKADVKDVVQPWADSTLDILPAGQVPPNPSELLGSAAMRSLLDQVSADYDIVLVDSPPVLPVTDAAVLGRQVGGALIVAGMDRIHRPELRETLESLETAGCKVLGLVINKIARREVGPYHYERGYYSSESQTDLQSGHRPAVVVAPTPERPRAEV